MANLLPSSATPQEKALAQLDDRLEQLPFPYRALWNPDACPLALLPYLAFHYSVDQWNDDWPEHIKRQTVKDALYNHRIKGSRKAVENAIARFGTTASIKEWWEKTPKGTPHTFSVDISAQDNERQLPVYDVNQRDVQLYGSQPIPVKTSRVYKVRVKFRIINGEDINTWAGVALLNKERDHTSGTLGYPRRHIAVNNQNFSVSDGWVTAEGEITGVNNGSPRHFTSDTAYIVPQMRLNWQVSGHSQVAYMEIWDLFENKQLVENPEFESGKAGWSTVLGGNTPTDNAPGTITTAAFRPDADLQTDIINAINQSKPLRSDFDFTVGTVHPGTLHLRADAHQVILSRETWE